MSLKVMVTGASGHVGTHLVPALAARGHAVRAAVRDAGDPARRAGLEAAGAAEVVGFDVRDVARFAEAAAGIDVLVHLAATYRVHTTGAAADDAMIRDSVEGMEAAIGAAAVNGLAKVVMTSSVAAVPLRRPGEPPATEADWQDDLRVPYYRAKTLAEREAWRLAGEAEVPLVTILPVAIIGPGFARGTPSTDLIEAIMRGSMRFGTFDGNIGLVDVRDVAQAHLLAVERDCAGRFIVADRLPSYMEITRIMHAIDPAVPVAPRLLPRIVEPLAPAFDWLEHRLRGTPRVMTPEIIAATRGKVWAVSSARAREELGWEPEVPLETSLAETMARIRELRAAA